MPPTYDWNNREVVATVMGTTLLCLGCCAVLLLGIWNSVAPLATGEETLQKHVVLTEFECDSLFV